tara:strand:- start:147 stop:368 length:222 start_codon:yes stop_codon:yes gene_type:complete
MPARYIKVNNGVSTQVIETEAATIDELFTNEFREDFQISCSGKPTINGAAVSGDTPIQADVTVGFINGASSKS